MQREGNVFAGDWLAHATTGHPSPLPSPASESYLPLPSRYRAPLSHFPLEHGQESEAGWRR